jgi:hypothetical protein
MDFNIVSKNSLGAVGALLLVVILSQARFFNFLLDTALGRAILIVSILFISYANQILGVISILFIIIMFNNSDIGYMEGFVPNLSSANTTNVKNMNLATPVDPALNAPPAPIPHPPRPEKVKTTNSNTATEGYDIIGTENSIKRGKQSAQINVSKPKGVENFQPFDNNYSDSFSRV